MDNNLWILTEEKPKSKVIAQIIDLYGKDFDIEISTANVKILPVTKDNIFQFTYLVKGIDIQGISDIYIKTVSGSTSFVDFLVFKQVTEPKEGGQEIPIMAIEETKTSDEESRNTGVSQRGTKFVYIKSFYPNTKLYMLYNEELCTDENKKPSDTSIFGTNIFLTLGVKIVGKDNLTWFEPFKTISEVIAFKNSQKQPPRGNIPVRIEQKKNSITISGRLAKPKDKGNIGHDPNIGTLSMIAACLRSLGWEQAIIISQHGVSQEYINRSGAKNKFIYICKLLKITLEGITLPSEEKIELPETYWHYECSSEKTASILLHIIAENNGLSEVYQNHAGCERGYFFTKMREQLTLPKKAKDGTNLLLPDVILYDKEEDNVLLIEGKKLSTLSRGVEEIKGYGAIKSEFIEPHYPKSITHSYVSIFGGNRHSIPHEDVLFYLNKSGELYVNENAPKLIQDKVSFNNDDVRYEVVPLD